MNINLKLFLSIFTTIILLNYAWSNDSTPIKENTPVNPCLEASLGTLDLKSIEYRTPAYHSFLFNCALASYVGHINESSDSMKMKMKKKLKLASVLLDKGLDINYNDEYATTLLMSVVITTMPKKWKLNTVKKLITLGSSIHAKNIYGKTAMDFAVRRKNIEIIKILAGDSIGKKK